MDLQPAILEYLCRHHKIGLPGLGTLRWIIHRVRRDRDRYFTPPSLSLDFSPKVEEAQGFVRFLSQKYALDDTTASHLLDDWCMAQNNTLKSGQTVRLQGLGIFQSVSNDVQFAPQWEGGRYDFHTGEISLQMVDRGNYTPAIRPQLVERQKERHLNILEIVLPVVLIGLIVLLGYFLYLSLADRRQPSDDKSTSIASDTTQKKWEEDHHFDTLYDRHVTDASQYGDTTTVNRQEKEKYGDTLSKTFYEEKVDHGEEERILTQAKKGECIVVVGSFKKAQLADRARSKILNMGLKVYAEPYGDFTRVGVLFDCETQDLYRTLFQLRGKFSEDAWILKYK